MTNSPAQTTRLSSKSQEASLKVCRSSNDRISVLPDELIHQILSFLSTKEAAATSVLSKRWVSLWTLVPTLNLEDSDCCRNDEQAKMKFLNFVDRVLLQNKAGSVEKFRLNCYPVYDHSSINTRICSAIDRGFREVDISVPKLENEDFLKLPSGLFFMNKLKILKLQGQIMVDVPISVCLPSLRILHLIQVKYANAISVRSLISGCLNLKELCIEASISQENMVQFNISKPTLNSLFLTLKGNCHLQYRERIVDINTPSLNYINFSFSGQHRIVGTFPCLVEANIFIRDGPRIEQIRALNGVKCLKLHGNLQHLSNEHKYFPSFVNLTQLELHGNISWDVVWLFLQSSPTLETLEVHDKLFVRWIRWTQPSLVPNCFVTSLTRAYFKFEGLEQELKMIAYFLEYASLLRKMEISSGDLSSDLKFGFLNKLFVFPRRSKACKLSFD